MKPCPFCFEQIQDEAIICRFCQRSVVTEPAPLHSNSNRNAKLVGGFLVLAVLASIVLSQTDAPELIRTAGEVSRGPSAGPTERLEILASKGYRTEGGSYMKVEGQVKNISDATIDAVVVVVTWYSDDGTFIASDKGMADFQPLLPGQVSPFSAMVRRNPLMTKFSVEFQRFSGQKISHKDSSK